MNYTFADYETAVLTALADLKAPTGYLATLEGYSGQVSISEEGALIFLRGYPGVLVEVAGAEYQTDNIAFYSQKVSIIVYVVARSWRDQDESRGGPTGAYTILSDIRDRLLGQTLGLAIRTNGLQLVSEKRVAADQSTVIFTAEYELWNDRVTAP